MKTIVYKASDRGHANHGWLDTYHTFSFANYYNPERINFGALRVVNDDVVKGGYGFGKHPHDNMEIVSIPLTGNIEHRDSMGNKSIIGHNEVQVMSAGTGIFHSEYNASKDKDLNFFQIWVFPKYQNVKPRYDQQVFDFDTVRNTLIEIVSPDKAGGGLWLNQDAWFNVGTFVKGSAYNYNLHHKGNGVFAMVIDGEFKVEDQALRRRDAVGICDTDKISFEALTDNARILLIEVPMIF